MNSMGGVDYNPRASKCCRTTSVVWLFVLICVTSIWARSHYCTDSFVKVTAYRSVEIYSRLGRLDIEVCHSDVPARPQYQHSWRFFQNSGGDGFDASRWPRWQLVAGFGEMRTTYPSWGLLMPMGHIGSMTTTVQHEIWIRYWILWTIIAIAPIVRAHRGWVACWRRGTGRCVKCGYDLHGTPDRCPECGAACEAASPAGESPAAGN